jgi:peptidoglycan/LPS O-acetylase OafA/YrhL
VVGTILLRIPDRAIFNLVFQQPSKGLILANLLLVQNLVGHYSISGPLWSLPYEVQMYVVLPLCYFAFRCKPRGLMYLGCTWIAFACIGVAIKLTTGHANMAGFVPCFLSGVVAYLLAGRVRPFLSAAAWPLFVTFWVGGLTILMAVYVPIEMELGWIGCLVLGISIYAFRDSRIAAWNKVTHNVAKYSYGIYLGHSAALWLVFSYWRIGNPVVGTALWLTLTGIIATGSYHLLEEPLIEVGRRLSSRLERSRESEALSNPERVAVQS